MPKKHIEPRILNPIPDGPLRKEKELYKLLAEVWLRRQRRLMKEQQNRDVLNIN